jgi:hypothetical protein
VAAGQWFHVALRLSTRDSLQWKKAAATTPQTVDVNLFVNSSSPFQDEVA